MRIYWGFESEKEDYNFFFNRKIATLREGERQRKRIKLTTMLYLDGKKISH